MVRSAPRASLVLSFGLTLAACSGSQSQPAEEHSIISAPTVTEAPPPPPAATAEEGLNTAQKEQLEIALRRGGEKSSQCVNVVPDAPRGEGEIKVTFDGKKGRATDVTVGPPFAGTPVEGCIKRAFIGEIVVPFDGELEVPYTIKLPPKAGDDAKDPKAKDPKAKDPKKK